MFSLSSFKRLLILALLCAPGLQAEQLRRNGSGPLGPFVDAPPHHVFLNPLGFLYGTPGIGYEQMVTRENSFTAQLGFRNYGYPSYDLNYIGVMGSYRWWLGRHATLQGFYAGPLVALQSVNASYDVGPPPFKRETANSTLIGVGAEGGYQWIFPFHLTLGAGLNAGYYLGTLNVATGGPSIPFGGPGLGLSGSVGYAF